MRMTIDFITLDDGYSTTQGTAYMDGRFLVTKQGRGEFDVLNKIAFWFETKAIHEGLGARSVEAHVEGLMRSIETRD